MLTVMSTTLYTITKHNDIRNFTYEYTHTQDIQKMNELLEKMKKFSREYIVLKLHLISGRGYEY